MHAAGRRSGQDDLTRSIALTLFDYTNHVLTIATPEEQGENLCAAVSPV